MRLSLSVFLLSSLLLVNANAASPKAKPSKSVEFTAYGGEEGNSWRAVLKNQRLLAETERKGFKVVTVSQYRNAHSMVFRQTGTKQPITLTINKKACRDSQKKITPYTATLRYKGKTYQGCAVPKAYETADT